MATFIFTLLPQEVEQRIVAERDQIVLKRQLHTQILRFHPDNLWALWDEDHSDYPDNIKEYDFELCEVKGAFAFPNYIYPVKDMWLRNYILKYMEEGMV